MLFQAQALRRHPNFKLQFLPELSVQAMVPSRLEFVD